MQCGKASGILNLCRRTLVQSARSGHGKAPHCQFQRWYSINGNQLRPGMPIEWNGAIYQITKTQHVKPGKGGAFMQVEMKDVKTGAKAQTRFRAAESVERVQLESPILYQVLYVDGGKIALMHPETYDQIELGTDILGDRQSFVEEGMMIKVLNYQEKPFTVELPEKVICTIQDTEPYVKGATKSAVAKPATLHNGVKIKVPAYVEKGDQVEVVVETAEFVKKA